MHEHLAIMKQKRTVFDYTASFFDAHALSNVPVKCARSKKKKRGTHRKRLARVFGKREKEKNKKVFFIVIASESDANKKKKVTPANNNIDLKKKKGRKQKP